MKKTKVEGFKKIEAILTSNCYQKDFKVQGIFTDSQIRDMKEKIGRDFVICCNNCSFNLKYFDTVTFKEIEEVCL